MKNQFVTFEIALKLKELGFNFPCFSAYTENGNLMDIGDYADYDEIGKLNGHSYSISCLSPLWQQCVDWFRDKHHTNIEINRFPNISKWGFIVTDMTIIPKQQTIKENINMSLKVTDVRRFDEYFECREQAILKGIELINGRNI